MPAAKQPFLNNDLNLGNQRQRAAAEAFAASVGGATVVGLGYPLRAGLFSPLLLEFRDPATGAVRVHTLR